jgi:hypothetical protein
MISITEEVEVIGTGILSLYPTKFVVYVSLKYIRMKSFMSNPKIGTLGFLAKKVKKISYVRNVIVIR